MRAVQDKIASGGEDDDHDGEKTECMHDQVSPVPPFNSGGDLGSEQRKAGGASGCIFATTCAVFAT